MHLSHSTSNRPAQNLHVTEFNHDFFPSTRDEFIRPVFFIFFIFQKLKKLRFFENEFLSLTFSHLALRSMGKWCFTKA